MLLKLRYFWHNIWILISDSCRGMGDVVQWPLWFCHQKLSLLAFERWWSIQKGTIEGKITPKRKQASSLLRGWCWILGIISHCNISFYKTYICTMKSRTLLSIEWKTSLFSCRKTYFIRTRKQDLILSHWNLKMKHKEKLPK